MRTHDMFDVVSGVSESNSSLDAHSLRVSVNHEQTQFTLDGRYACRQLVVCTPSIVHADVVHLQDPVAFEKSAAVCWRSSNHLTSTCIESIILPPPLLAGVRYSAPFICLSVCLSVCMYVCLSVSISLHDNSKSYRRIFMKYGEVWE